MAFQAEKALKNRIILLTGPEDGLRRVALNELLERSGAIQNDFDLEVFDGGSSKPIDWISSCSTAPFFGERRVAVVRHLLNYGLDVRRDEPILKREVDALPSSALLILVADDESGSDDRMSRIETRQKNWEKLVAKLGGHVEKCEVGKRDVVHRVREHAKALGLSMPEPVAELMAEICGNSLSRAMEEMEKLPLYLGDRKTVREEDVKTIVVASREWNVFALAEAALTGNMGRALAQARDLVGSGDVNATMTKSVMPVLLRSLKLAWQARNVLDAGGDLNRVPASVSVGFPKRPNLESESPFARKAAFQLAERLTLRQISSCFQILAETAASLRGHGSSFTALDTLERMLLRFRAVVRR